MGKEAGCRRSASEPVCLCRVGAGALKTSLSSEVTLLHHSPAGQVHSEGPASQEHPVSFCVYPLLTEFSSMREWKCAESCSPLQTYGIWNQDLMVGLGNLNVGAGVCCCYC